MQKTRKQVKENEVIKEDNRSEAPLVGNDVTPTFTFLFIQKYYGKRIGHGQAKLYTHAYIYGREISKRMR